MAKSSLAKLVDRHIEKVVLGGCVLLLVYSLGHWVFSSPRRFRADGIGGADGLRPAEIDKELLAESERVVARAQEATPAKTPVKTHSAQIAAAQTPRFLGLGMGPLGWPQTPPEAGPPPIKAGPTPKYKDFVATAIAPRKPQIIAKRELLKVPKPDDTISIRGAAVLPFKTQAEAWDEIVKGTKMFRAPVVAQRLEIQVEETLPSGRKITRTIVPVTKEFEPPTVPAYTGRNGDQVRDAVKELQASERHIWQPPMLEVWHPQTGDWVLGETYLPRTSVHEATSRDATGAGSDGGPPAHGARDPAGRRPVPPEEPAAPRARGRRAGAVSDRRTTDREALVGLARRLEAKRLAAGELIIDRDGRLIPGKPGLSERPRVPAALTRDRRAPTAPVRRTGQAGAASRPAERPGPAPLGDMAAQRAAGQILLWWHEANLKPEHVYRYRVRAVLINPLLARDDVVAKDNLDDARIPTLTTPWSEWSDPTSVARAVEFFVLGRAGTRQITVAVFGYALGGWVLRRFTVAPGEPIGEVLDREVMNPIVGQKVLRAVDFSTGAVAVAFEVRSPYLRANGVLAKDVRMLYLDAGGELRTMINIKALRLSERYIRYSELKAQAQPK